MNRKKISKKQEKIYFLLAIAIILLSLIMNINGFSKSPTPSLISNDISFPISKDSEEIKEGFNLITGKVVEEVYNFGLPIPVENIVTSTSTTSTTTEIEFGIIPDLNDNITTTTSTSTTTIRLNKNITPIFSLESNDFAITSRIESNYGNLSIASTNEYVLLLQKSSGLEKYLFYNVSHEKISTNLSLTFNVNRTVYNYLENCYKTQTLDCCNTIKTYVEDDYPSATCRQINNTLVDYIENGWRIYQKGIDKGTINVTRDVVTMEIPDINHLDEIRLGKYSLTYEYQDIELINYNSMWFNLDLLLYVNISNEWKRYNDIWLQDNANNDKFGADWIYRNKTIYFMYSINSSNEIKRLNNKYYIEKTETNPSGGLFTETHNIDFSDICNGNDSFDPQCNFNLYNVDRGSFIEYILNVTFYDNDGSIDPTISVDTTSGVAGINTNTTSEGSFQHLTLNDSYLILYLPFDTNTSLTTVYDYTSNNNDGTVTGSPDGIRWNYSGYFGGGYIINQSIKSYIQLPDIVAGQKQITVNMWFRSNVDNTSTSQTLLEQVGAGRDPILLQRNNAERYTFVIDNGTVQSTALITYDDTLVDTDWHMITGMYNGTDFGAKASLYIDGSFKDNGGNIGGNITHGGGNLFIGADSVADSSLNGTIDEVMIWNRTLTAQEITDLYRNQSARFYTQGKQEFLLINMTADQTHDRANITYFGQNLSGSYLQSRLGQWNITYGYNNTDTGLVGYWHFDNLSNFGENDTYVYDFATGGNNGTTVGGASPTNSSDVTLGLTKFGGSYKFDGVNDYINIPYSNSINITGNITVSVWVYSPNFSKNGMIVTRNPVNTQWEIFFESNLLKWRGGAEEQTVICTAPSSNNWHHIVGQQNQTTGYLYLDGSKCDDGIVTTIGSGNGAVDIGRYNNGYYFNGTIDEVMIWNRSLSASEIKSLYIKGRLNYDYTNYTNATQMNTEINGNTTYLDTINLNVTNITQLIPEISFFAGNASFNPFYSPVLIGNFTVTTYQTVTATTTTSSSSTLPRANLTLYLRNSTAQASFIGLYTNITAFTNESVNITSKEPYPSDVNMTLFVTDYAGINQSRNVSKSFLENFTDFWTPGDYLINITWEGNLTIQPNSTAFYITVLATSTTSSSSSTLPHANLTLYLRNSTGVELYKNITALTNESINITSSFPYPADVNMTLYVMDYAGVNQSRNISKSFLENFTTFWTTGSFLINITWEGNLTMFGNSTAFWVDVNPTTTTSSSTSSSSTSSSTLPKANLTLYLTNATATVQYKNITIETNQTLNITSKDNFPLDANITLFVQNYTGGTVNFNYSKSFLQNLTNFWTNGSFLVNVSWEGNLTFTQNSTSFYVDVLSTTTSSSTSSSTTSSTTSTTLPKAYLELWLNGTRNANLTTLTNQSVNITVNSLTPADANITLFLTNYAGVNVSFNHSRSFLQNATNFWTDGNFLANVSWEGNLTYFGNSTAFYVTVLATSTTSSTTTSTSTTSTSGGGGEPETTPGGGSSSSSDTNAVGKGKTIISNVEHKARETIYTFQEIGTAEPIDIKILDPYMLVIRLVIEINKPANNAEVKITKTILPKPIPNTGKILEAFEVTHENLPNSFINKVIFTFKIPKDTEDVALFKYDENSKIWNEIQMLKTGEDEITQTNLDSYSEKIEVESSKEASKKEEVDKNQGDSYDYYRSNLDSLSIFAIAVKKQETKLLSIKPIVNRLTELKLSVNNYFVLVVYIVVLLLITGLFYLIFRILRRAKSLIRLIANILVCLMPLLMLYLFFTLEFDIFIFGVLPLVIFSLIILLVILAFLFRKK